MPVSSKFQDIAYLLSKFIETHVDYRGRIYVPKKCRKKIGMREGDKVYIELEEDCFKVYTARGLRKRSLNDRIIP